jgi:NADPH:quinone reductase-like Zn-dependent oxidoreductase
LILGQDFSGEVIEVAEGVSEFKAGDEVFGFAEGSYTEYASVSPAMIAYKPRTVDFETAAGLPTPALTAYQIVMKVIQPSKGQTVLIQGAAGGVGSIATQLCKKRGARVVATASSKDTSYLKKLNVEHIIDYKTERFEEKVKDVDAVIDLVGGETLLRSFQVIKSGGILATTVGPLDETEATKHEVRGVQIMMEKLASDLTEISKLVDQGILKTRLSQVMPLTHAKEAQDLNQTGHSQGKVVLKVA